MSDKSIGRHSHERETAAKQWLEQLLKTKFKEDLPFGDVVKDGEVLCRGIAVIDDALIPKINEKPSKSFLAKENLHLFMGACEELGVPRYLLPGVDDIYNGKNVMSVVECVESLVRDLILSFIYCLVVLSIQMHLILRFFSFETKAAIIQAQLTEGDWRLPPAALLMKSNEGNNKVHKMVSVVNNQQLLFRNPSFSAEKFAIPILNLPSHSHTSTNSTPFGKELLKTPKGGSVSSRSANNITQVPITPKDLKPVAQRQDSSVGKPSSTSPRAPITPKEETTPPISSEPRMAAIATPSLPTLEPMDDEPTLEDLPVEPQPSPVLITAEETDNQQAVTRPRTPRSAQASPRPDLSPKRETTPAQPSPRVEEKKVTPRETKEEPSQKQEVAATLAPEPAIEAVENVETVEKKEEVEELKEEKAKEPVTTEDSSAVRKVESPKAEEVPQSEEPPKAVETIEQVKVEERKPERPQDAPEDERSRPKASVESALEPTPAPAAEPAALELAALTPRETPVEEIKKVESTEEKAQASSTPATSQTIEVTIPGFV